MRRRAFLAGIAAGAVAVVTPIVTAAAYTTRQLVAACRLWLKRHHVRRYATVTIIPGDGPPRSALLEQSDESGNWRWAPHLSAWVGPAYNVSWPGGVQIPRFLSPFDGQHVQLYVGDWTVENRPALADPVYAGEHSALGLLDSFGGSYLPSKFTLTPASGSGVAFVVQAQVAGLANLVPNPSFEADTAGWSALNGTMTRTGDFDGVGGVPPIDGAFVLRVDSPGAGGGFSAVTSAGTAGMPVVAGSRYRVAASIWMRSADTYFTPPGASIITPGITVGWQDAAGVQFAGGRIAEATIADSFEQLVADVVAPPGAAYLQIQLNANSVGAAAFGADMVIAIPADNPPADATAPLAPIDVRALLGVNVTVDSTFTYPPDDVDAVGDDGDYYLDRQGKALYGPKNDELWPEDPAVEGFNLTRLVR